MGKKEQVYPRDCFACGNPMVPKINNFSEDTLLLECPGCEISEDGTVTGRFHTQPLPFTWGDGDYIPFIDHSNMHVPSPDVTGD
jgi:hypothetical protein